MKNHKTNIFAISTPSQMVNALELIYHLDIHNDKNIILISSATNAFNVQIKKIGNNHNLEFYSLFNPKFSLFNKALYNRMPLKLWRLIVSKYKVNQIIKSYSFDRLILGNYSNFISQYCTQILNVPTFVLDDGNASIPRAEKREREFHERIPFFEFNRKKKGLWLIRLIMGFNSYKIPKKLLFFSSYSFKLIGQDEIINNKFSYLKNLYGEQKIDTELVYFVGSPISESGYVSQEVELKMILNTLASFKKKKMVYIAHRLDSKYKLAELNKSVEVLSFNIPIEFALTQNTVLPLNIGGFFTGALLVLTELIAGDTKFYSIKISDEDYKKENLKRRALKIYEEYNKNQAIEVKEYKSYA